MRKSSIVLALLSVAALGACSSSADDTADAAEAPSATTTSAGDALWGRTFLSTEVTGTPIPGGGPLEVAFPETSRIAMSAGCNRGVSSVELTGGVMRTGAIATTMTACPEDLSGADTWMTDLFASEPTWALTGDVLTISSPTVTVLLADDASTSTDLPLVGTTWVVDTLISPGAISTSAALEASAPSLTVDGAGRATGTTGCNNFTGAAEVGPGTVTFGPLATTRAMCPPDVAEVEQTILHVLDGEVSATVDGTSLELMRPDGYGLRLRGQ